MATTAGTVIDDVTRDLHDAGNVRWVRADLLAFLNDGQREIVLFRPDASTAVVDHALAAGSLQTIPTTALRFMRAISCAGRALRDVPVAALNDQRPSWRLEAESATIKAVCYDDRDPKRFEVWPPAIAATQIKILVSVAPTPCANEAASIAVDDQYKGPLMSYIRHRAYLRDSESADAAQMSADAYLMFMQQLGVRTKSEMAVRPDNANPQDAA